MVASWMWRVGTGSAVLGNDPPAFFVPSDAAMAASLGPLGLGATALVQSDAVLVVALKVFVCGGGGLYACVACAGAQSIHVPIMC